AALVAPGDDRVAAREGVDRRRDPELGGAELEVAARLAAVRPHRVDDEPDRRVELRREGLVGRRELRPEALHEVLGDLALEPLLVGRRGLGGLGLRGLRGDGRRRRRRLLLGAQLVDQLLLPLELLLHLLELLPHGLELAPQLLALRTHAARQRGPAARRSRCVCALAATGTVSNATMSSAPARRTARCRMLRMLRRSS